MTALAADEELLPGGFRQPSSVFLSGDDRTLLKWVALALLAPYASRVYWTDVRLEGEETDPLDPILTHAVPPERVQVVHARELQRDEEGARRVESASASMIRSEDPPESLRRVADFLRLSTHTQERISSTAMPDDVAILVVANAHRLVALYPEATVAPTIRSILESGAGVVVLWSDALPSAREGFDLVLRVEGRGIENWRDATLRCDRGAFRGPLSTGKPFRLSDLPSVARVLERQQPISPAR